MKLYSIMAIFSLFLLFINHLLLTFGIVNLNNLFSYHFLFNLEELYSTWHKLMLLIADIYSLFNYYLNGVETNISLEKINLHTNLIFILFSLIAGLINIWLAISALTTNQIRFYGFLFAVVLIFEQSVMLMVRNSQYLLLILICYYFAQIIKIIILIKLSKNRKNRKLEFNTIYKTPWFAKFLANMNLVLIFIIVALQPITIIFSHIDASIAISIITLDIFNMLQALWQLIWISNIHDTKLILEKLQLLYNLYLYVLIFTGLISMITGIVLFRKREFHLAIAGIALLLLLLLIITFLGLVSVELNMQFKAILLRISPIFGIIIIFRQIRLINKLSV